MERRAPALINTPLQRGAYAVMEMRTVSTVSYAPPKPLKRFGAERPVNTPLKRGVNEKQLRRRDAFFNLPHNRSLRLVSQHPEVTQGGD